MNNFKPEGYNSLSPYFIVNGAQKLIDMLQQVFNTKELRRYDAPDGTIMHIEIQIDDSVIMMGDSSEKFPANQLMVHVYVQDADETYRKAMEAGFEPEYAPREQQGDPDRRGAFKDFAGNSWSIGTQMHS